MTTTALTDLLPKFGAAVAKTVDFGAAHGDAVVVLQLLIDGKVENPSDVTSEVSSINHRYARELLGMLRVKGMAEVVGEEHGGEDVWVITDAGRTLAQVNRDVIQLSQNRNHRPLTKEHTMASTKTKTTKAAKATKIPKTLKGCGCGCGTQVKGLFAQGHDARMVSQFVAETTTAAQATATEAKIAKSFSDNLAAKFAAAADRKLNKPEPKPRKAAAPKANKKVTAKVGRWTKEGTIDSKGQLHTADAKGNAQVIAKGKYELI